MVAGIWERTGILVESPMCIKLMLRGLFGFGVESGSLEQRGEMITMQDALAGRIISIAR